MAVVAQAKGVYAVGTISFVADVPAAIAANDILLVIMESSDSTTAAGTPATPADWTKLFEETQGAGATGVTTLTIFGKVASGSETDVTVSGVGNHCSGTMFAIRGAKASIAAADLKVGTGTGAASGNMAAVPGITVDESGCLGLLVCSSSRDANNAANWSAWASVNGTGETEWEDNTTSTGAGGGIGVAWYNAPASGSTGDGSATIAVSVPWRAVQLIFEPLAVTDWAIAFDLPLGLVLDTAMQPTEHPLAFDLPLGLVVDTAMTAETFLAFDMPLDLLVETVITHEVLIAFDFPLEYVMDTNLETVVEHFMAFDMPLGLSIETQMVAELFFAFAEAFNLQIDSALTREAFIDFSQDLGLAIDTEMVRETFAAFDFPLGLSEDTNLVVSQDHALIFGMPLDLGISTNLGSGSDYPPPPGAVPARIEQRRQQRRDEEEALITVLIESL